MATNEEVEAQRKRVDELRASVEQAKTTGSTARQELENDIQLAQLQAEEARLAAELVEHEHRNDATVMARGATPLATAQEQMAAAVAQQQAVAATVVAENKAAAPTAPKTTTATADKPTEV